MSNELGGLYDKAHRLLPVFPDVVVHVTADEAVLEKTPPWVVPFLAHDDNAQIEGMPLSAFDSELARAFETIAEDVLASNEAVTDYCIEFEAPSGLTHGLMIFADTMPVDVGGPDRVLFRLHDVSSKLHARRELVVLSSFHGLIGQSNAMRHVFRKIAIYGPSEAPVVVTGETGTGKELVARAIHSVSSRRNKPYVSVNCSAISSDLFESELFGHDRGAFTGAARSHRGRFERASGGTLFLDEIGDMPSLSQTKLLRVLETGEVERVGGEKAIEVDVRVVAATNVPLEEAVGSGNFRADLFHRLAVFRIHVPPLRNHLEDIPLLAEHFLGHFGDKYNRPPLQLTPEALALLQEYSWPGNIRELRNVIERVVVETPGTTIGKSAFAEWAHERFKLVRHSMQQHGSGMASTSYRDDRPGPYRDAPPAAVAALPPPATLDLPDDVVIEGVLSNHQSGTNLDDSGNTARHQGQRKKRGKLTEDDIRSAHAHAEGNLTQAARLLGIHKATLYRHMKRLGLSREDLEAELAAQSTREEHE